jgi:hypothetical protein
MYGRKYTAEEVEFIKINCVGRSWSEVTRLFNEHFGLSLTRGQIESFTGNHHLRNGLDGCFQPGQVPHNKGVKGLHYSPASEFKKGHRPWNYKPVGTERINSEYVEVKIADPKKWRAKHVVIWEAANGPVPKGHVVIFADGNRRNMVLDNLLLISRGELSVMNHLKLISADKDFTKIGKTIADISMLAAKRKRELKDDKKSRRTGGKE